jgi:hypothetical protein
MKGFLGQGHLDKGRSIFLDELNFRNCNGVNPILLEKILMNNDVVLKPILFEISDIDISVLIRYF